jgi:hypothetical protein
MTATILNSPCANVMSIYVVRAFVQLRELVITSTELKGRTTETISRASAQVPLKHRRDTGAETGRTRSEHREVAHYSR